MSEAAYFLIWYRPGSGHRWAKAGRAATYAEALTLIGHGGDWHIQELRSAPIPDDLASEPDRPVNAKPGPFPAPTTGPAQAMLET